MVRFLKRNSACCLVLVRLVRLTDLCVSLPQTGKAPVEDLFSDLCDGRRLLELLEGLAGHELV